MSPQNWIALNQEPWGNSHEELQSCWLRFWGCLVGQSCVWAWLWSPDRDAPSHLPEYEGQVLWWWSLYAQSPRYHDLPTGSCWNLQLPDIKSLMKGSALGSRGENTALLTCWSPWSVNRQMDREIQQLEVSKSLWTLLKVGLKRLNICRIRKRFCFKAKQI